MEKISPITSDAEPSRLTQDEVNRLQELNEHRDPLQQRLLEEAERLFEIWSNLNPREYGWLYFKGAELVGSHVRIDFEHRYRGDLPEEESALLPVESFLDPQWEENARARIAERTVAEEQKREASSGPCRF